MEMMPQDVNPKWLGVIRRLQSVAKSEGLSVLKIRILVGSDGVPIAWTSPEKTLIEPKRLTSEEFRAAFLLTEEN